MKHTISITKPNPHSEAIAAALENLTRKELSALARKHGTPVKKYKADTAKALGFLIGNCGATATLTLTFAK